MGDPDKRGGGAESYAQKRHYDYHLNANLVLTATREGRPKGKEPTGEPESLAGRRLRKMGDRAAQAAPDELTELKKRKPKAAEADAGPPKKSRVTSVLEADVYGRYHPKSRETRDAHQALLQRVQARLGDHAPDILYSAADEVLDVLKDAEMRVPDKEKEVRELLGAEAEDIAEHFHEFLEIAARITDWQPEGAGEEGGREDEYGVAVDLEDDDDGDGEEFVPQVVASGDEGESGDDAAAAGNLDTDMDLGAGEADALAVRVNAIDAYWLQREIADAFKRSDDALDAAAAQQKERDVMRLLAGGKETAELEADLVYHLDYKRFELIQVLIANRKKIVWCTKLMRAHSDDEKAEIEGEMYNSPDLVDILAQLKATRASARDRKHAMIEEVREEARRMLGSDAAGGGGKGGAEAVDRDVAARQVLDLEALQFDGGGHFLANKSVQLPKETFRKLEKGYEEVHIPAPKRKGQGEKLVAIKALPPWAQPAFAGMTSLNAIQSKVCDTALHSAANILMCAPTGAGKTNVAVLTILQAIGANLLPDGSIAKDKFKIVYVAPMKALVAEMVGNFQKRLDGPLGITTKELTGDISLSKAEIEETQIIVTTPEKWDIITRKSGERAFTQLVSLLIIDEVHLLHDDRGPVLESIIARTVRQVETTGEMVRLVGLSATLPNYEDVATLLRVKKDKGLFHFNASYRPCPMAQTFIGVTIKKPLQRFQLMNEICYKKILDAAGKHQVMIFVHSRKETAKTARYLKQKALEEDMLARFVKQDSGSRELLQSEAEQSKDAALKELLPYGFGCHHAGMGRGDRTTVEELFAEGHIQVLVSTATLAWGVNLPAHTVIIKGTQVYNPTKSGWDELSPQDTMQMLGRAGRPQYDTFGEGVIITQHSELHYYLSLLNEQLPIESQLVKRLPDILNAEVVLGSVQSLREAASWLGYTYLNIRMLKAPTQYGVPLSEVEADRALLGRRKDLVHSAALDLDRDHLIRYDRKSGAFQSTDLGRIASGYYITHTTLREYNEHLKPSMGEIELLKIFCLADEFKYMVVRDEEKLELARLSQRVPIPIKDSVEEPTAKINVLLQAYISGLKLEGLALMADLVYISQSAGRLMRCLFEICLRRNWAPLAEKALLLCKAVTHRMWTSQNPLRQFRGKAKLPNEVLSQLEKKEIPWERYFDMRPAELGELVRNAQIGRVVHKLVSMVPRLQLEASIQPLTRALLRIDLVLTPDFRWDEEQHGFVQPFLITVEDQDSEFILHKEFFYLKMQNAIGDRIVDHNVAFTVPIADPLPPQYFIRIVSDRWLGSESYTPVSFKSLVLPRGFNAPTERLDLNPLPVSALRSPRFERLFREFKIFNPIQTQVFSTLYSTSDNTLVCAPTGSGKTVCAEFAIMRMLATVEAKQAAAETDDTVVVPPMRAVYVASLPAIVKATAAAWEGKFGEGGLGLTVVQLTGEQQMDFGLIASAHIVLATAEQWDRVSRRWHKRKAVSDVSLFIADELHLLGAESGPALEVVVSRMRSVSKLLAKPMRFVGLGSSIADASDVGDWLGVPSPVQFNFPPHARAVPLEIHIQSLDIPNFEARIQAMSRPTYSSILQYAKSKPAIVFAPTRRHAKQIAADLMTYAARDNAATRWLKVPEVTLEPYLEQLTDDSLRQAVLAGVGILHDTLSEAEAHVMNHLFAQGAVQVLVATAAMCRSTTAAGALVVVLGTQFYDSSGLGGEDFPVADLVQMLGLASRPGKDDAGVCVLMCHAAKKEYYKTFLFEPLPVESHLDQCLHDHLVAEAVVGTIKNKQEAVDWLTYTFFYRRLPQNPNYYNMMGRSHSHIRDHLSELVEDTCTELHEAHAILVDETGMNIEPENLGTITAYHHISFRTAQLCHEHLTAKSKMKAILQVLSHATEFESLPMRPGDDVAIQRILRHAKFAVASIFADVRSKTNALLQAHFGRTPLRGDLAVDQQHVLKTAMRLLHAIVDILSSKNHLAACILAMEMCQMVVQGMHARDPLLMQVPGVSRTLAEHCEREGVDSVVKLEEMADGERRKLLAMSDEDYAQVAAFCNRYPDVALDMACVGGTDVTPEDDEETKFFDVPGGGDVMQVRVVLERQRESGPVFAPRFPGVKQETWWLVVGDGNDNLLAIKRVTLGARSASTLSMEALPPGRHELKLSFMCDSYLDCDQEYPFVLNVGEAAEGGAMEEG